MAVAGLRVGFNGTLGEWASGLAEGGRNARAEELKARKGENARGHKNRELRYQWTRQLRGLPVSDLVRLPCASGSNCS